MGYIESSLSKGEKVIAEFPMHWILWLKVALLAVIVIGLPWAIVGAIRLLTTEHGVTNKRMIKKYGWIARRSEEVNLRAIETVEIAQTILGRILNYGDIKATGRGVSDLVFLKLADPMEVKRTIEAAL